MDEAKARKKAEALLREAFNAPVELEVLERFESDHLVLRLAMRAEGADLPETVILKQRDLSAPRQPNEFDQHQLFSNEWASLDFLASLEGQERLGPRLYASEQQAGLVVLEDLGEAKSVQGTLYETDPDAALTALLAMGEAMGRLAARTYGREADFLSHQAELKVTTPLSDASLDCRTRLDDLQACRTGLGIEADGHFDLALKRLEAAIHEPGPLRAFIHQDAGPHNFVLTAEGATPLDYEFAGFGQCLIDIVCVRLSFPPAFRGRVLAREVTAQVEARFRSEAARAIPALGDDAVYHEALSQACAHWAFSKLIGFWRNYLRDRLENGEAWDTREGRQPERAAFFRRMVFTYLWLTLDTLEETGQLDEIRAALERIVARLLHIWPETPLMGAFPAFGGEPWRYP